MFDKIIEHILRNWPVTAPLLLIIVFQFYMLRLLWGKLQETEKRYDALLENYLQFRLEILEREVMELKQLVRRG